MNWRETCAVVVPCFDEARRIGSVVQNARAYLPNVVVVDDGSTDPTSEEARAAGARVIRLDRNTGKGAALVRGFESAAESGFDWALAMDGDGQHAAGDIPRLLQRAAETGAPLIVGNRMAEPRNMPLLRRAVNRWMSRRISARVGLSLPDTQCGFRLLDLRVWRRFEWRTQRFEVESEMLLAFARAGERIEFVPIQVIYAREQSKIRPFSDTMRWLRWWYREPCDGQPLGGRYALFRACNRTRAPQ